MKVTFDSNLYRRVTDPTRFCNDPAHSIYASIHAGIRAGAIEPFLCATIVTLEAIGRDVRAEYLAGNRIKINTTERASATGSIETRMIVGADDSLHPGLPAILDRWLEAALALGFKFLAAPRFGQPRPSLLQDQAVFAPVDEADFEKFGEVARAIENRGLGIAQARALAMTIAAREPQSLSKDAHWSAALAYAANIHERRAIARAVAEWSDADAVAAHIAYSCDIFCTEDIGSNAGAPSVLAHEAREWLNEGYGLVVCSARQLAADIDKGPGGFHAGRAEPG